VTQFLVLCQTTENLFLQTNPQSDHPVNLNVVHVSAAKPCTIAPTIEYFKLFSVAAKGDVIAYMPRLWQKSESAPDSPLIGGGESPASSDADPVLHAPGGARALSRARAIAVFLVFAFAYFLSALVRAITATLAPTLTQEFSLNASHLGLLAGGYFLGFAAMQLPLGTWLDRFGPKKVILTFLALATLACLAFALATSFPALLLARILCGAGVSACLMAPLAGYRRWFTPSTMMRTNAWMLMTGSLGMVASTLPVQWLLPVTGWRVLFFGLAALVVMAMALIAWRVPRWESTPTRSNGSATSTSAYAEIWRHPYFRRMAPIGFFCFGGLVAMQTLWAAPWLIKVAAYTPMQAATGLFWINVAMLCGFWVWGVVTPWLSRHGFNADRLIAYGLPISFLLLALIIQADSRWPVESGVLWALYCVSCTFASLAQPAVGMAFAPALTGRAFSAYNLVIFVGIFVVQWGLGLLIDTLQTFGLPERLAFQTSMSLFLLCCIASYVYFLTIKSHNQTL
jgi:predicted MFS family arabinose efflux permease